MEQFFNQIPEYFRTLHKASNGIAYYRVKGLDNIDPILRMQHTTHCFKAFEVNPMTGCDHGCVYCAIQGLTQNENKENYIVYDDFPIHLEEFILKEKDPKNLTFAFTLRADAFSPIMLESGITENILNVFEKYQTRYFIFTKGGHNGTLPRNIFKILGGASNRCHVVMSMGLPNSKFEDILEPRTAKSNDRLEMVKKLRALNIPVSGSVAPFLPLENSREYAYSIFSRYKKAGVSHVSIELLKVSKEGLDNVIKYIPEYEEQVKSVFDFKHKMEVDWKILGGDTVDRFFTNKDYLVSQLKMASEVTDDLDMSLSVCVEVANLAGLPEINKKAAKCGYTCAGVVSSIIQKTK